MKSMALMIDGANTYATARALGIDIDYRDVLTHFGPDRILRAFYFTALPLSTGTEFSSLKPLLDWLQYNGWSVITKPVKEFSDQDGRRKVKGNMDVEIAVAAVELAPHISELVLFTGDGDLRSLIESVQRHGVRVTVVSTIKTQPAMIADELRRQADVFLDLDDLKDKIAKPARAAADRQSIERLRTHFTKSPAIVPTA